MNAQTITPQVTKKECRFVVYLPPFEEGANDYHFVKEIIHYDDGTTKPNLRAIANFQRDIWVTKKGFQNHQESKEWELVERLDKGRSTQSDLPRACAKLLGQSWMTGNLRAISSSPYLYGTDILSTSLIKQGYADKYPMVPTKYSVAVFDTETDVINGTGDIIIASITFKKKALVVVRADFLAGYTDVINRIRSCANKYIKEYLDKREVELEIRIVDTSFEIAKACFDKAHEWKPDFLAMWNIKFDVARVIEACQQAMVDPKEIFCDPSVPAQYKRFEFILGPEQKVTSSGKITPIKNEAQWHTVKCPSSFYIIDAMCVFKHNRIGEPDKPSYSLDNILNTVLGIRKLAFTETEHLKGLKKHQVMQSDYKFEYIVYNIFDCISVEELDEKTNDLSTVLPLFSGCSDFSKYNSQPRRTADELHFECMKLGYVIGTTGKNVAIDLDEETVDVAGWIDKSFFSCYGLR